MAVSFSSSQSEPLSPGRRMTTVRAYGWSYLYLHRRVSHPVLIRFEAHPSRSPVPNLCGQHCSKMVDMGQRGDQDFGPSSGTR